MDNQALLQLVDRIVKAPDNDARIKELMNFAPEALLQRAGLTHRSSMLESTLSFTGAMTVGMMVGASAALMLVPGARSELRARIRKSLDRVEEKSESVITEIQMDMKDPSKSMTGRNHTPDNHA